MKVRFRLFVVATLLVIFCPIAIPQSSRAIVDRVKQSGLIDETNDPSAPPIPFKSAQAGLAMLALPNSPFHPDYSFAAKGLVTYDGRTAPGGPYFFMSFVKGSPFYPSIVRRRVVVKLDPDGVYLEVHSAIFCSASADQCALLRAGLNKEDTLCGVAIVGCPGYIGPLPRKKVAISTLAPPPPPPPPPKGY